MDVFPDPVPSEVEVVLQYQSGSNPEYCCQISAIISERC